MEKKFYYLALATLVIGMIMLYVLDFGIKAAIASEISFTLGVAFKKWLL